MAAWDILYRVTATWYHQGQNCINSFFFRTTPTSSYATIPLEMNALNSQIGGFLLGNMRDMMASDCQLLEHVLVNLNGPQFYQIVNPYNLVYGNVAGGSLPSFCSTVVGWYTATRGRRAHGRTYIPAVPLAFVSGSDLTTAAQNNFNNKMSLILNNFSLDAGHAYPFLVVYSRKNGNGFSIGPPPAITYDSLAGQPVTRFICDTTIYTQRHRLKGRGI